MMIHPYVKRTEYVYDVDRLLLEWERLETKVRWYNGLQTCLQYDSDRDRAGHGHLVNGTCFIDGAGSFKQTSKEESSYDTLVPCYEGTLFENIINDLSGVRTRVMVVSKHTTYSIHKDRTKRYHLALITNPHAFFLFPNAGLHNPLVNIPVDGYIYEVDTTQYHSFINCGENRTHLVIGSR